MLFTNSVIYKWFHTTYCIMSALSATLSLGPRSVATLAPYEPAWEPTTQSQHSAPPDVLMDTEIKYIDEVINCNYE